MNLKHKAISTELIVVVKLLFNLSKLSNIRTCVLFYLSFESLWRTTEHKYEDKIIRVFKKSDYSLGQGCCCARNDVTISCSRSSWRTAVHCDAHPFIVTHSNSLWRTKQIPRPTRSQRQNQVFKLWQCGRWLGEFVFPSSDFFLRELCSCTQYGKCLCPRIGRSNLVGKWVI